MTRQTLSFKVETNSSMGSISSHSRAHLTQSKEWGPEHLLVHPRSRGSQYDLWSIYSHLPREAGSFWECRDADSNEGLMVHNGKQGGYWNQAQVLSNMHSLMMYRHRTTLASYGLCVPKEPGNNNKRGRGSGILFHPGHTEKHIRTRIWPELENFRQKPVTDVTTQSPDDRLEQGTWIPWFKQGQARRQRATLAYIPSLRVFNKYSHQNEEKASS